MKQKRLLIAITTTALCVCLTALVACGGTPEVSSGQSEGSSPDAQKTTAEPWSPDSDCTVCHATESDSFKTASTAMAHAQQDCMTCHTDESYLQTTHDQAEGASIPDKLSSAAKIETEVCIGCHSTDTLKTATESGPLLTDSNGSSVNPHDLPEGHLNEKLDCVDCHSVHSDSNTEKTASDSCLSCHHEGVFQCGTCHE